MFGFQNLGTNWLYGRHGRFLGACIPVNPFCCRSVVAALAEEQLSMWQYRKGRARNGQGISKSDSSQLPTGSGDENEDRIHLSSQASSRNSMTTLIPLRPWYRIEDAMDHESVGWDILVSLQACKGAGGPKQAGGLHPAISKTSHVAAVSSTKKTTPNHATPGKAKRKDEERGEERRGGGRIEYSVEDRLRPLPCHPMSRQPVNSLALAVAVAVARMIKVAVESESGEK
ncbi:hypothetical protein DL95DRAFT_447058 [Leptodontidium sp. 2 PMI_412]|nr:hypothetical protein DL95DRAFT_447058 [Leptodontidium sp. 2 PMI_412]